MSNYQEYHMTPDRDGDCNQGFCFGVEGGLCIGMLEPANNGTLWWCCKPYAETCVGGSSPSCIRDSTGNLSNTQIPCSHGSSNWCCSSSRELCAGENGIDGTCIPKDFPNPAREGPIWGPNAITSTTATISSTTKAASTGTLIPPTSPAADPGSSHLSAGSGAAIGAAGMLVLLSIAGGIYYFYRRRSVLKPGVSTESEVAEIGAENRPLEIQGQDVHELGSDAPTRQAE